MKPLASTSTKLESEAKASDFSSSVGHAIKRQRQIADLTMRRLANLSGVSAAMISRIESGQVSPSLATLEALADALSLSVVTFFADTVKSSDAMFTKAGEGISASRTQPYGNHSYRVLGSLRKAPLTFEAVSVTVERKPGDVHPNYINRGFVYVTITDGECIYTCGPNTFHMQVGDSIVLDAELVHGLKEVISDSVTYSIVSAKVI